MTARHLAALALLGAGVAVLLLSALALLVLPGPYSRVHALTPAASLGFPLVAVAAAVQTGPGRAAVKLLFIALLLAAGGAVTTMAVGRVTAEQEGDLRKDTPE